MYIGESEDVRSRLAAHERLSDWEKRLKGGETLCYSFAPVESDDRSRAEAAVIYFHKPLYNENYKNSFPFPDTTIKTSGTNFCLDSSFTVKETR